MAVVCGASPRSWGRTVGPGTRVDRAVVVMASWGETRVATTSCPGQGRVAIAHLSAPGGSLARRPAPCPEQNRQPIAFFPEGAFGAALAVLTARDRTADSSARRLVLGHILGGTGHRLGS